MKFYHSLKRPEPQKPGLIGIISFNLQKAVFQRAEKELADHMYWDRMGWLDPGCRYYYDVKINPFLNALAILVVKIWYRGMPKPEKEQNI